MVKPAESEKNMYRLWNYEEEKALIVSHSFIDLMIFFNTQMAGINCNDVEFQHLDATSDEWEVIC